MSDGGEAEIKRDEKNNSNEKSDSIIRSGAGNFGRAISRIAVAQVCESIGFEGFKESALDSLADIAIRYICDLGKASRFYASVAGRTECNVFDIVQGLEDLGIPQGFSGASEIHTDCVVSSGAMREIRDYVETAEEIPFAQPVPQFPVRREPKRIPSFSQMGETPSFKHIPAWLPAFPDPHTYVRTPVWNERVSDPRTDKIELARQHRKAERSLLNLQQRLVCNGSSVAATSAEPDDEGNELGLNRMENPFLAKPLQAGEKDVSLVSRPAKLSHETQTEKHVSLLETFAPAIEAMKDGLDSGSDGEKILPKNRSSVFLELKGGKKVFGEPLDLRIRNKAPGKTGSWFGREDEKDDKKRRVEFIIRQSMENQQEPPQL
ncbi:putative bromodomain transcription factor [Handroanthus impetiginosus]|uniref:Transcription initiation factor TFIID subunit 8 n=1 Tax=Handroanthus impetiginosus TaxID=429701 RepID=A0A2G9H0X0_9LAMI|nr:putative bromodomain transcription factor [Handroanthus impetiginosus]